MDLQIKNRTTKALKKYGTFKLMLGGRSLPKQDIKPRMQKGNSW